MDNFSQYQSWLSEGLLKDQLYLIMFIKVEFDLVFQRVEVK